MPATVTFVDIAGIVRGASEGEGLGNKFLAAIRESDAICQVVRAFADADVIHVDGRVDPADDIATVNTELILADLQTVDNRLAAADPRVADAARAGPGARPRCTQARDDPRRRADHLAALPPARSTPSCSPTCICSPPSRSSTCSTSTRATSATTPPAKELAGLVAPAEAVVLCAQIEAELVDLDAADAAELLAGYGQDESGLVQLVHVGFRTLGLQTFLTAGPKEARAWTIPHRRHRARGGGGDPHRLPAGVHQGRDRRLRGPDGRPARCRRCGPPARPASRARTT